ncbi:recombinase family protein [Actinacidiphila glaucinigra]|uniref:recombinase family protein n=1 Tax=Actinacidiphila glaucinigra TaxID=235986 RepID=UPI0036C19273
MGHGAAVRGVSARRMTAVLLRAQVPTGGGGEWTTSTLLRRLRNPALMGFRTEEDKNGGIRRSKLVRGRSGEPVRVAEPIFTETEWRNLQAALDKRAKAQPPRRPGSATTFLGVLVCADCGTNMTIHKTTVKHRTYQYLRCRKCPSGGLGAPEPEAVYRRLSELVLAELGTQPVRIRSYASASEVAAEPVAGARWVHIVTGETFHERWDRGGPAEMACDLLRAGITCRVSRTKVPGRRAPQIHMALLVPRNVCDALVVTRDEFAVDRL